MTSDADALQVSGVTALAVSASFVGGSIITGSGETVTAVGFKISSVGVLTGVTLTVRVIVAGVNSDTTIDATRLTTSGNGWHFITLATPVVMTAAATCGIQFSASTASRVTLLRDTATGNNNWNKILVLNDSVAPSTNDTLYIAGRITSTGGSNTLVTSTIVMDSTFTATSLFVGNGGIFDWTTNSLTFTVAGNWGVYAGGSLTWGRSGTRLTGTFAVNASSAAQFLMEWLDGATIAIYGTVISNDFVIPLTSTAASGQAHALLAATPDWTAGQQVVYSSSAAQGNCELMTISSRSTNDITHTGNFSFNHHVRARTGTVSGTVVIQEVAKACLLERGFTFTCSGAGSWYGTIYGAVAVTLQDVSFQKYGSSTAAKLGLYVEVTTGGSFTADNCSFQVHSLASSSCIPCGVVRINVGYTITNCLFVNAAGALASTHAINLNTQTSSTNTITDCMFLGRSTSAGGTAVYFLNDYAGSTTMSGCEIWGFSVGLNFSTSTALSAGTNSFTSCAFWACLYAVELTNLYTAAANSVVGSITLQSCTCVSAITASLFLYAESALYYQQNIHVIDCDVLGVRNLVWVSVLNALLIEFRDCTCEDLTAAVTGVVFLDILRSGRLSLINCDFRTAATYLVSYTTTSGYPPYYGGALIDFTDLVTNVAASNLMHVGRQPVMGDHAITVCNSTMNSVSVPYLGRVQGGAITTTTSTYSGTGTCPRLTPDSTNPTSNPFRFSAVIPKLAAAYTVSFKTKRDASLNGVVTAKLYDRGKLLTSSVLTVSASWDAQSVPVSGATVRASYPTLVLEFTGTAGYLDVDTISVA